MKLNVEEQRCGGKCIRIVKVSGYLDAHTFPDLEKTIYTLMNEGDSNFILDFEALDYISSAGLGLLLGIHRQTAGKNGGVKLVNLTESILRIFDILGFSKIIDIHPDRDSAIKAFGCTNTG